MLAQSRNKAILNAFYWVVAMQVQAIDALTIILFLQKNFLCAVYSFSAMMRALEILKLNAQYGLLSFNLEVGKYKFKKMLCFTSRKMPIPTNLPGTRSLTACNETRESFLHQLKSKPVSVSQGYYKSVNGPKAFTALVGSLQANLNTTFSIKKASDVGKIFYRMAVGQYRGCRRVMNVIQALDTLAISFLECNNFLRALMQVAFMVVLKLNCLYRLLLLNFEMGFNHSKKLMSLIALNGPSPYGFSVSLKATQIARGNSERTAKGRMQPFYKRLVSISDGYKKIVTWGNAVILLGWEGYRNADTTFTVNDASTISQDFGGMLRGNGFNHYLTPFFLASSRIANSTIAAWLTPSFSASAIRRRLASSLRRMLVGCFLSNIVTSLHYIVAQKALQVKDDNRNGENPDELKALEMQLLSKRVASAWI